MNNSKELTVKQVAINKIAESKNVSKKQAGYIYSVEKLELKRINDGLNLQEIRILMNAKENIESKTASRVYKNLQRKSDEEKSILLGLSKFPTFQEFTKLLPEGRATFSMWDGFGVLVKLNKQAQSRTKVDKQGGVIVEETVPTAEILAA